MSDERVVEMLGRAALESLAEIATTSLGLYAPSVVSSSNSVPTGKQGALVSLVGQGPAGEGDPMQIASDCDVRIRLQAQRDAQRASIEALREAEHGNDDGQWRDTLTTAQALLRREGPA